MYRKLLSISWILIILALAVFSVFFTANKYQDDPEYFVSKKKFNLKHPEINTREKMFLDEYQLAEFLVKEGKFKEAIKHFYNVYHKYPDVPKGQIKLSALYYMRDIGKILNDKEKKSKNVIGNEDEAIKQALEFEE